MVSIKNLPENWNMMTPNQGNVDVLLSCVGIIQPKMFEDLICCVITIRKKVFNNLIWVGLEGFLSGVDDMCKCETLQYH